MSPTEMRTCVRWRITKEMNMNRERMKLYNEMKITLPAPGLQEFYKKTIPRCDMRRREE